MNSLKIIRSLGYMLSIPFVSFFVFQQEEVEAADNFHQESMHPEIDMPNPNVDMGIMPVLPKKTPDSLQDRSNTDNAEGLPTSRSITNEYTDPRTGTTTFEISGTNQYTQYTRTVEVTPNPSGDYTIQGEGLVMSGPKGYKQVYTVTPNYNPETNYTVYTFQGNGPGQRTRHVRIQGDGMTITGQNLPSILAALNTSPNEDF